MSFNKSENRDYNSLSSSKKTDDKENHAQNSLKPSNKSKQNGNQFTDEKSLVNFNKEQAPKIVPHYSADGYETEPKIAEDFALKPKKSDEPAESTAENSLEKKPVETPLEEKTYSEIFKIQKQEKQAQKDFDLLKDENWITRNGHFLTYVGLYLFSILVFFRPYELVPGLGFLSATAFYFALATLFIYLPTQLATEGNLTQFSTEVKCVIFITCLAIITMPIAKSPALAWEEFNDAFSKAVVMFVVMANVLRTRKRLTALIWISLAAGFVLSYMALGMYIRGEITVEGYRVSVPMGGMFGNPNELALHLIIITPIAFCLGLATKNPLLKYLYFAMSILFVAANVVTYSRGGFLGLLALSGVLIWKLGKQNRAKIFAISSVFALLFIVLSPGEYSNRIFSIFDSSLDAVGSSNQRSDLLKRSLLVSARNPWGIGIGNFQLVGFHNLGTHNSYTQMSSELGILGFIAYLIFQVSPFRKLGAIERRLLEKSETNWFYYVSIGLQASIIGFMVSSFFAAVAYNWYVYYLIAYAVAFRRIYTIEQGLDEEDIKVNSLIGDRFGWQMKST